MTTAQYLRQREKERRAQRLAWRCKDSVKGLDKQHERCYTVTTTRERIA